MKPKKATATYREILKMQENLKDAEVISYSDLVRCPKNKLPPHVDKLQLQKYLSDTEFVDVFKMTREEFNKLAPWKQANLKKNVSLY
jgi:advillin